MYILVCGLQAALDATAALYGGLDVPVMVDKVIQLNGTIPSQRRRRSFDQSPGFPFLATQG